MERLVEEYSDTEVFQNFENISVDTDLICLDADHTNYSILIQLAKKGVNVLCQGLWNVENYLDVIREFKRNNKFVIEDESFLNFEKVSIFVDIAKKLLAFDPAAEIEIKTNCFNIYAAVRILGMFLPNMQQMTVEQHVEQDSKEWVWCRLRNKIVVFEIDKKIYYGLERKYTAKSVEFNIQTDRGNLSLRGYLGPIIWEGFFPEISNNENSKGYLFHPTIQTVDGEANYDWEEHFIPFFYAHGYNVYAMSFRNHGNSERIENVDQIVVKDMVEDLIKTIDIIDGKIILIAHSLGCRIAQMCLEEIYSSIQSVVLITPMPVRNNFLQLLQMSKKQRKNNLEYILFSERLDSEQKEYYMSLLDKESKKVEYAMMKRQKKFSIYVRKIPTLVIGSYNDQCVILQAVKDNAKIHTAELKIVDSVCHDMMLDPDWRNIADLIFKFIEKTIDKKSGDNYNDNYVSTQAHQGGE